MTLVLTHDPKESIAARSGSGPPAFAERRHAMRPPAQRLTIFEPASYLIRVQGAIEPNWSELMGGLEITVVGTGNRTLTELSGRLSDQAALIGVLNALYDLGLPILSVERIALA
jgi:hypothetical protein